MRRIVLGLTCLAALGAALFSAPFLWSQSPVNSTRALNGQAGSPVERPLVSPSGEFPNRDPGPRFGPPAPPVLEAIDKNGDGEITGDEIELAPAALKQLDSNSDGQLTTDEMMPLMPPFFGGGPGGPGGPMGRQRQMVKDFDKDGDAVLDADERTAARAAVGDGRGSRGPGGRGFGPPGGPGGRGNLQPATAGPRIAPSDVESYPDAPLFDTTVLRTLFLDFENEDWEAELADFKGTDVEVPARLTVDGQVYPSVGVHFRGMSSYMMVPAGYKRSLNLSVDFVHPDQRLYGYQTLNLLNCSGDPSMMSTLLYSHIARQHIAAPKANFVKVVINGESWGLYANVQQFNKQFLAENYGSAKGARWKVSGNPGADGGLRYLGEDVAEYRRRFEIKSKEDEQAWKDLISLCQKLNETPTDQLEQALAPILDIDSLLWFLALDVSLVNSDGYWTRASDYNLFQDDKGQFHVIPHDMNEAFHGSRGFGPGGPRGRRGFPGGPGGFPGGPGGFGPPSGFGSPADFSPPLAQEDRVAMAQAPDGPDAAGSDGPGQFGFGPGGPGFGPGGPGGPDGPGFRPGGSGGPGFGPGGPGMGEGAVTLDPLVGLDDARKPLRSKVLAVPSLRERYLRCVRSIAETSLDWKNLGPVVAEARSLIQEEVAADTRKLSTSEAFLAATAESSVAAQDERAASLQDFARQRRTFLLEYPEIAKLPRESSTDSRPAVKTTSIRPADAIRHGVMELANPPVVISEFLAAAQRPHNEQSSESEDWIELFNRSEQEVDLSGAYLSDDRDNLAKWSFPAGTTIPSRGFLIVWADENGKATAGLHANFKLSKEGEEIYLTDRHASDRSILVILDHVEFSRQTTDVSYGRYPDGQGNWQPLVPSPGKGNRETE